MINKIFKTIFILSLCLGISLPSYTAVSVADGSAYVSKAEFAADVNALSNRMAQLENSLDSKIDSLVSTYLTRNGIWNAKKQLLTSYTGFTNTVTGAHLLSMYQTGTRANLNKIVDNKTDTSYNLVDSLDKSGLVNVVFNTQGSAISIMVVGTGFNGKRMDDSTFTNHRYFRDLCRYTGSVSANLYLNNNPVYSATVMDADTKIDEGMSNVYDAVWFLIFSPKSYSAFFFGNKGDSVSWNIIYNAVFGEIATGKTIDHRGDNFSIKFDSVSVY